MTREHKARYGAGILACLVIIIAITTITTYAAPPTTGFEGNVYPDNYNREATWQLVQATQAVFGFSATVGVKTGTTSSYTGNYSKLLLLCRSVANGVTEYYAYVAQTTSPASAADIRITNLPETITGTGITITLNGPTTVVSRYKLQFTSFTQVQCAYVLQATFAASSSRTFTLPSTHEVCYVYDGVGIGFAESYRFGSASAPSAFQRWVDAWDAYENGLGYTQEQYDANFDAGYNQGYTSGYTDGYASGHMDGYADGYADGLENGASAEEIESAYLDGFGYGYAEGEADGYLDGYSNGSSALDVGEIISSVPEAAKGIINSAFGFELFGINVAGLLSALIVVGIIAFVVKWLMSR